MKGGESAPTPKGPRPAQKYFGFLARSVPPRKVRQPHVIKLLVRQAGALQAGSKHAGASSRPSASKSAGSSATAAAATRLGPTLRAPSQSLDLHTSSLNAAAMVQSTGNASRKNSIDEQAFIGGMLHNLDAEPDNAPVALALATHPEGRTSEPVPSASTAVPSASTAVGEDSYEELISGSPRASTAPQPRCEEGRQLTLQNFDFYATKKPRLTGPLPK